MSILLGSLAGLRLTRFVTTDKLGEWLIARPVRLWGYGKEVPYSHRPGYDPDDPVTWQGRLAAGVECPFCVGFWIDLVTLAVTCPKLRRTPLRLVTTALAVNYVTGHISARIDGGH